MKRLLSILVLTALVVASCSKYDDTELRNKVNGYESRIAALEALSSYKDLLGKLSAGKTVTGFSQSGNEITLTFSDNTTVKFNQQGPKGDPGESIKGDPGDPGDPGSPGQDGVTPQFKIEGENWMVSYDEGKTWKSAGSAIDRSLIKDIKVEGDVLKITLADGTLVPVTYGEKEGFQLILNRHVVTCYESPESFIYRELRVPYTLTGDLTSVDDVKFTFTVTDKCYQFIPDYQKAVTVEKTDAKSGYFVLHQKGYWKPGYKEFKFASFEDSEFIYEYPETDVSIIAYFPDGSTRTDSVTILEEELYGSNEEAWIPTDSNGYPYIEIPASAGTYPMRLEVRISNFELYDGPKLDIIPTNYLFYVSYGYTNSFFYNEIMSAPEENDYDYSGHTTKRFKYPITLRYGANNTGKVREELVNFVLKSKPVPNSGGGSYWMGVKYVQAK